MNADVLLLLLNTGITLTLLVAYCVAAVLRRDSRSTRPPKQPRSPPPTQLSENPSDLDLAKLAIDQAELFSTLGKLTTTVKRLSSRQGMQDSRARKENGSNSDPPVGTSKAELLRHYGMSGKVGPEFARAQQQFELRDRDNNDTEH